MTTGTSAKYVFIPNACRIELFRSSLLRETETANTRILEAGHLAARNRQARQRQQTGVSDPPGEKGLQGTGQWGQMHNLGLSEAAAIAVRTPRIEMNVI